MTLPPESQQTSWSQSSSEPARRHVEKPKTVLWGTGILWVGVVLSGIVTGIAAIAILGIGENQALASLGVGMLVALVALLVVQAVLLVHAGRGRNWARIALAVLAGASLVLGLVTEGTVNVGAILMVVAIVLLFVPQSNAWYAAQRRG